MSSYAEFYLKTQSGDFVPIGAYSRSNKVYELVQHELSYEECRPITLNLIKDWSKEVQDSIAYKEDAIEKCKSKQSFVMQANNSLEEKMEVFNDIEEEIACYKEEIETNRDAEHFLWMLEQLWCEASETKYYSNEAYHINPEEYIYAGIDCGRPDMEGEE